MKPKPELDATISLVSDSGVMPSNAKSFALAALSLLGTTAIIPANEITPVPFTDVRLSGGLLGQRQQINADITLPFALRQCETENRLKNFELAAETLQKRAAGETQFQNKPATIYTFDDTDVYKVIEGAAYCLSIRPDPALAAKLESYIAKIASAQEPDGYLFTFRTMHPDSPAHDWVGRERWEKDPILSHELYNLGHLYEAGVAHYQATQSRSLLDICLKSAQLVETDLGDGTPRIATGHQVIEMGLAKLYRQTGEKRWLDLARLFIDNRDGSGSEYSQNHLPVLQQTEAVGHAVRANYMYSGMADVAALSGNQSYFEAIQKLWENVVSRKLYLTGGCGARAAGEAYGNNYELPHNGYNETCAAIAFLYWNHRMFLMTGEAKYMDVFERALYNGVLSGIALSGDRFFYPNPLEYDGQSKNNHGHAGRAPWFGCACCPPNILRLLASLGGYSYATSGSQLFVNLYAEGTATVQLANTTVKIQQTTDYPWQDTIKFTVDPEKATDFTLALRVPGWVQGHPLPSDLYHYDDPKPATWSLKINGQETPTQLTQGYAAVKRVWQAGDTVELALPMPVRRVAGNAQIEATRNQVALERGPVVYTFEGLDNDNFLGNLFLPTSANIRAVHRPDLMGGVTVLAVEGAMRRTDENHDTPAALTAIPYAFWNNRGLSAMRVWLPRDGSAVRLPPKPTIASRSKVTVSFARGGMDIARLNDQIQPLNATDGFVPNFDFWPHKGGTEWIDYTFEKPVEVRSVTVSWFDDTGIGECRIPTSWRVLYQAGDGTWMPVKASSDYPVRKRDPIKVSFEPVTTPALRLELVQPDGFACGLYEWSVE